MNPDPPNEKHAPGENAPTHIEPQPIPGHTENIPTNPARDDQRSGQSEQRAPTSTPDTKPGTPPGTQSERDRLRTND